jgi:hypothetical protein
MKERYETYKANEDAVWKHRFMYRGLYGDTVVPSASISKFNHDTGKLSTLKGINSIGDFYKAIKKLAEEYVAWVKEIDPIYTDVECHDMGNFFVGALGEFFVARLLEDTKCLYTINGNTAVRYDFNYVAPILPSEKDFGVDLTGMVNDRRCVIQVKFWNPMTAEVISIDTFQKAYAEGVAKRLIDPYEEKNVVMCWLGDESTVSYHLKENKELAEHIIFVNRKAMEMAVEKRNNIFWENLTNKLAEI